MMASHERPMNSQSCAPEAPLQVFQLEMRQDVELISCLYPEEVSLFQFHMAVIGPDLLSHFPFLSRLPATADIASLRPPFTWH